MLGKTKSQHQFFKRIEFINQFFHYFSIPPFSKASKLRWPKKGIWARSRNDWSLTAAVAQQKGHAEKARITWVQPARKISIWLLLYCFQLVVIQTSRQKETFLTKILWQILPSQVGAMPGKLIQRLVSTFGSSGWNCSKPDRHAHIVPPATILIIF